MSEQLLSDQKLDELFVKNIQSVTRIVEKLPNTYNTLTTLIIRWFEILRQATPDQKLARNFLLLLMHQQLNDKKTLGYPFTNPRNYQMDLNTLHKLSMTGSMDDDDYEASKSLDCNASDESKEQLIQLNSKLSKELVAQQREKERLLQLRHQHRVNFKALKKWHRLHQTEISYLKDMFFCSSISSLKMFTEGNPLEATIAPYFSTLFKVLIETKQDMEKIIQLDKIFTQTLHKHVDYRVREYMREKMSTEYDTLRSKVMQQHKTILDNQLAIHKKELSITGSNYLIVLKKLFTGTFKGDVNVKLKIVECLHQEYDGIQRED